MKHLVKHPVSHPAQLPAKLPVIPLVIATGIASVATQLAVIREFLCLFSGNEFVISVTLFNWLFLGGCGTLLFRIGRNRFPADMEVKQVRLAGLSVLLCLVGTLQIPLFRIFYNQVFIPGQAVGFYPTLAFTAAMSAPYCLLVGYLLPVSLDLAGKTADRPPSATVYIADNIGDTLGGVFFSFFLVWLFPPVRSVFIASLPLWLLALRAMRTDRGLRPTLLGILVLVILGLFTVLETRTLTQNGQPPLFYEETPYARVMVTETGGSPVFFQNNLPLFDTRNSDRAEKLVHYPLSQVDRFDNILVISAAAGIFRELEKYAVGRTDYVEIDARVTRALFRFGFLKSIDGLRLVHRDARRWLRETDTRYDAVILNLSDPDTYQVNRFFTREFFGLVRQRLADGGVFSFSVTGYNNYPSPELVARISSLHATLATRFERVLMLPGPDLFFLCKKGGALRPDIPAALREKGIRTRHIEFFFDGDVTDDRIAGLKEFLEPDAPLNLDFSPELIRIAFQEWFARFGASPRLFGTVVGVLFIGWLAFMKRAGSVLFFTGFFTMGAEMMVIFVFQVFFGYIYVKVGIIITLFLAGLLPGAYIGEKLTRRSKPHGPEKWIIRADTCLVLMMAGFVAGLAWFPALVTETVCLAAAFGFGFCCGFEFPCAAGIRQESVSGITTLFAADLAGAAFGILFFSLVLVPNLGILWAGLALACVKAAGLARFILWKH